jgi:hypothetical protein
MQIHTESVWICVDPYGVRVVRTEPMGECKVLLDSVNDSAQETAACYIGLHVQVSALCHVGWFRALSPTRVISITTALVRVYMYHQYVKAWTFSYMIHV